MIIRDFLTWHWGKGSNYDAYVNFNETAAATTAMRLTENLAMYLIDIERIFLFSTNSKPKVVDVLMPKEY